MKNLLFPVIGILVCIGLFVFIVLVISQRLQIQNHRQISSLKSITTPQPTENCAQFPLTAGCKAVRSTINICSKQYPNYPSRENILTTKYDANLGVFTGKVSKIDPKLQTITVTSQRSNNSFVFKGAIKDGKVYDIHSVQVNNISLVPIGVKVFISFPCKQEIGVFTLNRIQMVQ